MQMWPLSNGDPKAEFTIQICSTSDSINAIYANTDNKQHAPPSPPERTNKDFPESRMYEIERNGDDLDNPTWGMLQYHISHRWCKPCRRKTKAINKMIFVYVIFIKRLPLMIKSHDYDERQSNREQWPTGTKYLPATRTWQGVSGIMLFIHLAHYITM